MVSPDSKGKVAPFCQLTTLLAQVLAQFLEVLLGQSVNAAEIRK